MADKVKKFTDHADAVKKVFDDFKEKYPDAEPNFTKENGLLFTIDFDKL